MTKDELAAMGIAIWGHRWQSAMARALKPDAKSYDRTVRRWASGATPIPDWVPAKLAAITGATRTNLTTDEWIVGESLDGVRRYVVHTVHPRFMARAVEIDETTEEPVDPDTDVDRDSVVYRADINLALAELHWIDSPPAGHELTVLMEAACDAIEQWESAQDRIGLDEIQDGDHND